MNEQNINILERIHASYYQLTAAERKVADYVLLQYSQVQFMSITQLADECGIADATVSRFCRRLGLSGFNAFKIELAKYAAPAWSEQDTTIAEETANSRIAELSKLNREAILQTIELMDYTQLDQAVALFEQAEHVMCIGAGGSMIMAQECAHLFSTVTGLFYAVSDSHLQMSAAATMGDKGVIVLFSYSGATTSGLEVLELAQSRGIPTVLITRFHKSPAARLATVVLRCGSNEGPFQFGSVPARIAQLTVIDMLFQEYCHRNHQQCQENVRRIASALAGKHV